MAEDARSGVLRRPQEGHLQVGPLVPCIPRRTHARSWPQDGAATCYRRTLMQDTTIDAVKQTMRRLAKVAERLPGKRRGSVSSARAGVVAPSERRRHSANQRLSQPHFGGTCSRQADNGAGQLHIRQPSKPTLSPSWLLISQGPRTNHHHSHPQADGAD